ncbi:MAG: HDIG domain-containing protein [Defluviitaleaceae bacterium]|nr:HDIG domain-containing protein [Defluviitaleaceae bacterium]
MVPSRDEAMRIYLEYNSNEALLRHAENVEGVMRHFAAKYGEDVEYWGVVGLLHDIDYEQYPDEHCKKAPELLAAHGVDEGIIRSVVSHGWGICADIEPVHFMEKVLYAIDELTGLINAAVLMRPSKSAMDLEYKSLWKKYKTASFAAGVDRGVIERGCEMLGMDLKDVIEECIIAMRAVEKP